MNRQLDHHLGELNQLKLSLQFAGFSCDVLYWGLFDGTTWWRNYLHEHSFYEVCFVLKGQGSYTINRHSYRVQAGDLLLAKPAERHEIIASEDDPLAICFWSFTLIPQLKSRDRDLEQLFHAFRESQRSVVASSHCLPILELLAQEIARKEISYPTVIEGLTTQLIIEVARAFAGLQALAAVDSKRPYHHAVVDAIIYYLRDNYQQPMHLKEIAAQVHLSERHVSRLFKRVTGTSIKRYATQLKMDIAKQRLLNKTLSISEVAYETGYHDVRYFATVFRQHTGVSPTTFRERGGTEFI